MAVFTGTAGNNSLSGTSGIDTLFGLGGLDTLFGRAGDDTLDGGSGADTLSGADGDDRLLGGTGIDRLIGGLGNDVLEGGTGNDTLTGGDGDDTYILDAPGDVVVELPDDGIDTIQSPFSIDISAGGLDFDEIDDITLLNAVDTDATGNERANVIAGNAGDNSLVGNGGDDTLNGGAGADQLSGDADDDSLNGGGGNDSMAGGAGDDIYNVNAPGDVVTENASEGDDTIRTSISLVVPANVEDVVMVGTRNLTVSVTGTVNVTGNGGDNLIVLGTVVDGTFSGGAGNDILDGSAASDALGSLVGGPGDDLFIIRDAVFTLVEAVGGGSDTVELALTFNPTLPDNVENAIGTGGAETITGNGASNILMGLAGNDSLVGLGGADSLLGGQGLDVLIGGGGRDRLTGGAGSDQFRYNLVTHGTNVATNVERPDAAGDLMLDFVTAQDIVLFDDTAFDLTANATNDLPFGALTQGTHFSIIDEAYDGTNPGTNANHAAGVESFVFSSFDSTLYYDADGATAGYTVIAALKDGDVIAIDDIAMA